jgi:hypothetical protein
MPSIILHKVIFLFFGDGVVIQLNLAVSKIEVQHLLRTAVKTFLDAKEI